MLPDNPLAVQKQHHNISVARADRRQSHRRIIVRKSTRRTMTSITTHNTTHGHHDHDHLSLLLLALLVIISTTTISTYCPQLKVVEALTPHHNNNIRSSGGQNLFQFRFGLGFGLEVKESFGRGGRLSSSKLLSSTALNAQTSPVASASVSTISPAASTSISASQYESDLKRLSDEIYSQLSVVSSVKPMNKGKGKGKPGKKTNRNGNNSNTPTPSSINWQRVDHLTKAMTTLHLRGNNNNSNSNSDTTTTTSNDTIDNDETEMGFYHYYTQPTMQSSTILHDTIQHVINMSFHPYHSQRDHVNGWEGIKVGLQLMEWQASAATSATATATGAATTGNAGNTGSMIPHPLLPPHNEGVPRSVCLKGMKALNQLTKRRTSSSSSSNRNSRYSRRPAEVQPKNENGDANSANGAGTNGVNGSTTTTSTNGININTRIQIQRYDDEKQRKHQAIASYRILQRLCTGIGLAPTTTTTTTSSSSEIETQTEAQSNKGKKTKSGSTNKSNKSNKAKSQVGQVSQHTHTHTLDERDFNMVLNAFVNVRDMNMAHRVVALQKRCSTSTVSTGNSSTTSTSSSTMPTNADADADADANTIPTNTMPIASAIAPPLSTVTYSILCKGYGQMKDINGVMAVHEAAKLDPTSNILPTDDIILYNSFMDAYINCGPDYVHKAYDIFTSILRKHDEQMEMEMEGITRKVNGNSSASTTTTTTTSTPVAIPNLRTYNTMLKGFVQTEDYKRAMKLSERMKQYNVWDTVTTNTLVSVAVACRKFDVAESILSEHLHEGVITGAGTDGNKHHHHHRRRRHPHVEAYSGLIDGYAKAGNLQKALSTMKLMKQRHIAPNEYTYTSIIYALTKVNQIQKAKDLLHYMEHKDDNVYPSVVTYNAFLNGLLDCYTLKKSQWEKEKENGNVYHSDQDVEDYRQECNIAYDEAMTLFRDNMMSGGNSSSSSSSNSSSSSSSSSNMDYNRIVHPNAITIAALIDMAGISYPPRLEEAKTLFHTMEEYGYLSSSSSSSLSSSTTTTTSSSSTSSASSSSSSYLRASTALIRVCGIGKDVDGAMDIYQTIHTPDIIAFNALLNALCRNGKIKMAIEVLKENAMARNNNDKNKTNNKDSSSELQHQHFVETDVATYSILISSLLKIGTTGASRAAFKLYKEMKREWDIFPDTGLVDM